MTNQETLTLLFNNITTLLFKKTTPQEQADFIDIIADLQNRLINLPNVKKTTKNN